MARREPAGWSGRSSAFPAWLLSSKKSVLMPMQREGGGKSAQKKGSHGRQVGAMGNKSDGSHMRQVGVTGGRWEVLRGRVVGAIGGRKGVIGDRRKPLLA